VQAPLSLFYLGKCGHKWYSTAVKASAKSTHVKFRCSPEYLEWLHASCKKDQKVADLIRAAIEFYLRDYPFADYAKQVDRISEQEMELRTRPARSAGKS